MSNEISRYDIDKINKNIHAVQAEVAAVGAQAVATGRDVKDIQRKLDAVETQIKDIKKTLDYMIYDSQMKHNLSVAETRIVKIRQDLERKYGNYAKVRNTTLGILQASDVGIVRKDTVGFVSDEFMITTPGYWLAPCLVAVSSWINNEHEIADKAVKEAIKRDDEQSSLFFALVCRRAERLNSCYEWTYRYLLNQNPEDLDVKCILVLDAFANGLLGSDAEGKVYGCMRQWVNELEKKENYLQLRIKQWRSMLEGFKEYSFEKDYTYLSHYCLQWSSLRDSMAVVGLNRTISNKFSAILCTKVNYSEMKAMLDKVLMHLITDFDKEERPLRDEERKNSLIISYKGDIRKAESEMKREQAVFDRKCDFTVMLTEAAMGKGEFSSISTQKFALSFSRDWILNAYNDINAENDLNYPETVAFEVNGCKFISQDGKNEPEVMVQVDREFEKRHDSQARTLKITYDNSIKNAKIRAIVFGVIAGVMLIWGIAAGVPFLTILAAVSAAVAGYSAYSIKGLRNEYEHRLVQLNADIEKEKATTVEDIRKVLAQLVNYRREYMLRCDEGSVTVQRIREMTPDKYIYKFDNSKKRVKVSAT